MQCLSVLHEQNREGKSYYKTQHSQDCWKYYLKKKKIKKHLQWRFMPTNLHTIIVRNFCSCFSKRARPVLPACAGRTTTPPTSGDSRSHRSHMAITGTKGRQTRWSSGATESNFFVFYPLIKWMQNISVSWTGGKFTALKNQQHNSIHNHFVYLHQSFDFPT